MRVRNLLIIAIYFNLTACVSWEKIPLSGRDHPSGFADQIRETARSTYEYAQLATNSYAGGDSFQLGRTLSFVKEQEPSTGNFQYKIFNRVEDGNLVEIIIAYRGTDAILGDLSGNALLKQQKAGLVVFDNVREEHRKTKISVTGHSLGGAIASHVTLNRENVDGYFFNTSPRFARGKRRFDNLRHSVVEFGDILKSIRLFGREPTQIYTSINCTNGGVASQHSSRNLAECLTWIAAWEDVDAKSSVSKNSIARPDTRSNGPDVPRGGN
ncbi:hypothetical protein [Erythrobacter sp. F6033]|uniref:lipase family protein n=1 Tax=Erythrobacter sp. F6033 TaxID=2926401 RepID=UPI001FF28A89|nr:hypothetical protein [Erythrobacter sp. F6033]MCK0127471.1 hypothetical protein [Erythrobacter sp. F6033]